MAVFGCGPVGQLAIDAAWRLGAGRVVAVDNVAARLEAARSQHAEPVNCGSEDPVAVIRQLTGGIGADRVIDAVGVDAYSPNGEYAGTSWPRPPEGRPPRGDMAVSPRKPRSGPSSPWPKPTASGSSASIRRPCGTGRSGRR
ncbi:MAG TPA: zinc-binding dehydrogenase [Pseudonocardiaceae bacterium]|nr:zinc-binding dehydrogenase [Pseudonocardiaceae bacterium]